METNFQVGDEVRLVLSGNTRDEFYSSRAHNELAVVVDIYPGVRVTPQVKLRFKLNGFPLDQVAFEEDLIMVEKARVLHMKHKL